MDNDTLKTQNPTAKVGMEKGASLKKIYDDAFPELQVGEIVKGRIVRTIANGVIVDLGLKSEAFLPLDEFSSPDEIQEGKEIKVLLESLENKEGVPIISKKRADFQIAWKTFEDKLKSAEALKAKVVKKVKGGLMVEIMSQEAFLPGSQVDIKPIFNFESLIGQIIDVKILSLNPSKRNIVVSRRAILEEQLQKARNRVFSTIKVGDVVEGTVTSIADFGAFIDIDGVDALLHISDLSWEKVIHPKEVVNIGDKIKVKVLNLDPETYRITVGRKQLEKHPWEEVEKKYPIGTKVQGRVTALAEYGAFVELEPNVEGLIHISEMSWTKVLHHPSQILKVNDIVSAVVLNIDRDNRRISLGLKQAYPDPWSVIEERFQIGQKVTGHITALKNFGAFVEIEPGIEGLIRNQDLSWTKRVRHPREVVKKNQKVEAIILDIDKENRQLALGLKQTKEDPFYKLSTEYKVGDEIKGRIVDYARLGIIVSLPYGIEGYVPRTQLINKLPKKDEKESGATKYQIGDELSLKITYIDFDMRRIGLSEKALLIMDTAKEVAEETKKEKTRRPRRKAVKEELIDEELKADGVKWTFEDHLDDDSALKRSRKRK